MSTVKIKFAPVSVKMGMYALPKEQVAAHVSANISAYVQESALFDVQGCSQDAAEEVFDLTNNPGREFVREQVYGRGPSLSVGDIVVVDEEQWLCMSFGWVEV